MLSETLIITMSHTPNCDASNLGVGDLDGSGINDLVVSTRLGEGEIHVMTLNSTGNLHVVVAVETTMLWQDMILIPSNVHPL